MGLHCLSRSDTVSRITGDFESPLPARSSDGSYVVIGKPGQRLIKDDPERLDRRVPTISFTHDRLQPDAVCERLDTRGIFAWHGNFYALPVTEALGIEPHGLVRIGLLHYNTAGEVDRLLEALDEL